ncbi:sensor histidine kinase [Gloeothece verrucosa]|uniref:histidine kinase n=1 Tax=Gloeothece verrucosa (strain PCC 7822) TaxID=497965 RepID=E0UDX0_GLOV7|nr:HAMP domain-containing sensor histidine kinase [Gloeothece verrucosa]ADN16555.1 integral membrane sensor signal transduction histidine kinase [Gloeothece verrucosa PCC 7822]
MSKKDKTQFFVNREFQTLHWRLLLSYLAVMVTILGTSAVVVYQFFSRSIYQQVDNRLLNLAQAASHSLITLKHDKNVIDDLPGRDFDHDGDLDIPWQNLRLPSQGVEWYAANEQRLAMAGTLFPTLPLKVGFEQQQHGQIRTLTIPAYSYPQGTPHLEGYIRVSESNQEVQKTLIQLRWGFGLGGTIAIILTGIGGMWLTRQSLGPVEQSFAQLKQFTADASHELRSPLTVIKTSVEVMQTHPERIHPADVEKFNGIVSATKQMSSLVENLLLLARTEKISDPYPQEWGLIPLHEVLEDLVDFLELTANAREINLKFEGLIEVFIKGDSEQLSRLFSNLLNNALQYTPQGGQVTVSLNQNERYVLVSVEDTGIGISSAQLPHIFDRFWRADDARCYRCEGTGLGLAIAQAIAHRHRGEITVKSQLGVGSCFQVRLPKA